MKIAQNRWRSVWRPHPCWCGLLAALLLAGIGINAVGTVDPASATRQLQWLIIALGVLAVCVLPDPRNLRRVVFVLCVICIALLILLILPGIPRSWVPVRHGVRAWINLRFMMFQPSEMAKIVFVLAMARYLCHRQNYRTLRGLLVPFVITFVPVLLIVMEPDLGTAILFFPVLFIMLVVAGAKLRHLGTVAALAVLGLVLNVIAISVLPDRMQLLRPHQRNRIKAMISQVQDDPQFIKDIGYQQYQSLALVGSGGMYGYGAERSAQIIRFNALPENHNDMIFAVIVNRWGLVGGLLTLGLYILLIGSYFASAALLKDPFARLSIVGFATLLFTQMTINIGMAIGMVPIIGITLPFLSYGGSSLVMSFVMVGLLLNFASQRPAIVSRPSFEFDQPDTAMRYE